ncbi:PREDICTED: ATP-binding cassette sub-family G member 4 [Vollenhovia emeryi]|uniref:ATP-binding cassette sub-family G member 4 n=1 Tax=Vollenhovia emeryi TaxID=411798 RepID=UPI0005F46365|nr:PREDICTED: ATP-binding cassette sub-family G member 4 [Vollenhovia emeryi]XP_011869973.1 PREDICTED: ATP-binding cassette sub-family G member 4 [Vollenhovia emeryi]XP_011869974.1 PREDICTED: ATP-binding cassette sub-family G member 4 [Vollenhovia emeryi]XP_011869975.1 PREDICTED: ATP-binding cassette sub-family G member 4 [Vollenhovia emeryi]XP_011869976.1 PREDICTED: ATP-binding cassette sub-family G member 4 [Vollenhovia emeryi]XP_011869977.1 PREDICTED: ATP-binding cassette sub-family G membe
MSTRRRTTNALCTTRVRMVDIEFKDLSYDVQVGYCGTTKQILKNLNGIFKAAELTAIMGPSGAGKSTLLNILTGFQQGLVTGTLEYVSSEGRQSYGQYKKQSRYIQQTDSLYGLFTVQESMMMVTYLKLENSATKVFRQILIDNILDTLKLSLVKETRVDRLSGGQRKRLSIALELVDNPSIMFLDEPTTGLDSLASLQCISALQTLAKNGRTVICTIHQPSAAIYQLFDHIYLVVEGQCLYAGTPDNTVSYFSQQGFRCPKYHNPADYMLEVVNREYGDYNDQLAAAANEYCQREETPQKAHVMREATFFEKVRLMDSPTEFMKLKVLLYRCAMIIYRDWSVSHIKVILHFLVAILLGLLYEHAGHDASKTISNISMFVVTMVYFVYTSMIPAVLKFPLELAILKKERFNNWYQLRTYYAATLAISILLNICYTFIYSSIVYVLTGQPMELSRFLMFLLITILTAFISESVGLGLGAIFDPVNGTFFGAITTCAMVVLSGFLVFFNHMPEFLYYVSYLNYCRFIFEGFVQAIYGFQRETINCPNHVVYCHLRAPSVILEEMRMSKSIFWIDATVLLAWFVVIRFMVYVSLKRRLSKIC